MKKLPVLLSMLLLCGISFSQGIYLPVEPTTYGKFENRIKPRYVAHLPEKTSLTLNTTDETAQIFYYTVDSSVWAYSHDRGYFKIGTDGGSGSPSTDTILGVDNHFFLVIPYNLDTVMLTLAPILNFGGTRDFRLDSVADWVADGYAQEGDDDNPTWHFQMSRNLSQLSMSNDYGNTNITMSKGSAGTDHVRPSTEISASNADSAQNVGVYKGYTKFFGSWNGEPHARVMFKDLEEQSGTPDFLASFDENGFIKKYALSNISGGVSSTNFANTDLTFTGSRTHDGDGNDLALSNIGTFNLATFNDINLNAGADLNLKYSGARKAYVNASGLVAVDNLSVTGTGGSVSQGMTVSAPDAYSYKIKYNQPLGSVTISGGLVDGDVTWLSQNSSGTVAYLSDVAAASGSTSVTGILKGNGTTISAATAGTDYVTPAGVSTSYVPYTGATGDVDLGAHDITARYPISTTGLFKTPYGFIGNSAAGQLDLANTSGFNAVINYAGLTTSFKTFTLPNANGTFDLTNNTATLTNKTIDAASNTISNIANANISATAAIANSKLANSSVTVGSTNIALGATSTTLAGLTSVSSTSFVGALTGNASTASAVAASALTGSTLASGVTASSLTSLGTVTTGVWNGTVVNSTYGGTGVNNAGRTITVNTNNAAFTIPTAGVTYTFPPATSTLSSLGAETWTGDKGYGNVLISPNLITSLGYSAFGSGTFGFSSRTTIKSSADGKMNLLNNAQTGFTSLALGLETSSFPLLLRNGTGIDFKVGDNTAYTATQSLYDRFGSGSPESVVSAPVGAVYHRTDGGTGTSFYVKESGSGNTGWIAK